MEHIRFYPQGDQAITVSFGDEINQELHEEIISLTKLLDLEPFPGMIEVVPSFTAVTIYYSPFDVKRKYLNLSIYEDVVMQIKQKLQSKKVSRNDPPTIITIPVCYGGEYGPDLTEVARYHKLSESDVIRLHSNHEYVVYMVGFTPGFPYLGGMSERLATPRKQTPRVAIPAGSVGIGGRQTGIYPLESPGGWQIIGRTPLKLFNYNRNEPTLLKAGDIVRFKPITAEQYDEWDGE
ncbi:5-oxoprolinase subunit PxpB [Metabacillus sp. 22489]|uniref:5-oxoprolinase subunit PxpB n=1 Tax=Metabacillus sp. 22489 TaxID=3453928 RepID=UPI003F83BBD7